MAAGVVCVMFGVIHFLDRERPYPERRSYYAGSPSTELGRAALAVAEVALGFALLFTA